MSRRKSTNKKRVLRIRFVNKKSFVYLYVLPNRINSTVTRIISVVVIPANRMWKKKKKKNEELSQWDTLYIRHAVRVWYYRSVPVKFSVLETRFAIIVLLCPNNVYGPLFFDMVFNINISVSPIADPTNTPMFLPDTSDKFKPASIIASTDLSVIILVIGSIMSASMLLTPKNVASNVLTFFNFPVPHITPK